MAEAVQSVRGGIIAANVTYCSDCRGSIRWNILPGRTPKALPWDPYLDRPHECHSKPHETGEEEFPSPPTPPSPSPAPSLPPGVPTGDVAKAAEWGAAKAEADYTPTTPTPTPHHDSPHSSPNLENAVWLSIKENVLHEIKKHVPPPVEGGGTQTILNIHVVRVPDGDDPGNAREASPAHPALARVVKCLAYPPTPGNCGVWLKGDAGSGKSEGARMAGKLLGYAPDEVEELSICTGMFASSIIGYMMPQLSGPPLYQATAFRRSYEHGKLLLMDEIDKADGGVLASFQSGIDSHAMSFPDGMVKRHPRFKLIIASPTDGNGSDRDKYPASKLLPADFRSRFMKVDWPIDPDMEMAISLSINPECRTWVSWVQDIRTWCNGPGAIRRIVVSPRHAYQGARMLTDMPEGLTLETMAREVLGKYELDDSTWARMLNAVPLPKYVVK